MGLYSYLRNIRMGSAECTETAPGCFAVRRAQICPETSFFRITGVYAAARSLFGGPVCSLRCQNTAAARMDAFCRHLDFCTGSRNLPFRLFCFSDSGCGMRFCSCRISCKQIFYSQPEQKPHPGTSELFRGETIIRVSISEKVC